MDGLHYAFIEDGLIRFVGKTGTDRRMQAIPVAPQQPWQKPDLIPFSLLTFTYRLHRALPGLSGHISLDPPGKTPYS